MRVFISADMEGTTGIADPRDILEDERAYARGQELMAGDVNAAVEGALAAGAEEVVVNDSHWTMTNIPPAELHDAARLIRGSSKRRLMMQEFDESYDIVFFVGYHAMAGTPHAVLNHTMFPQMLSRIEINGREVGEMGINAGLPKHHGTPVGLVTGDDKTAAEAEGEFGTGEVETVSVKEGIDRFSAHSLPLPEARERITSAATAAVERADTDDFDQSQVAEPVDIEIEWAATNHAYRADDLEEVERVGGRTTRVTGASYPVAYDRAMAMINAASAAHNELFTW
ncbi:M55 family metallopeptidase [Haloplanus pelagicus]|uniref:M55 family metallopeptidase n=1 Tax=Haloplanus pelagicus TaxID=2949995 RepID=UPI00203DB54F|nr:M55 family metallopeptidase [Haloplanus sp. HW8-1]